MFDIGFSELFIVAVIALLVLGPERLPGAARRIGKTVGKVRASWNNIQTEITRELDAETLQKQIQDESNQIQQTLNNGFDIDAYNQRILEQEQRIREGIQREAIDPSAPENQPSASNAETSEPAHTNQTTDSTNTPKNPVLGSDSSEKP